MKKSYRQYLLGCICLIIAALVLFLYHPNSPSVEHRPRYLNFSTRD